MRYLPHTQRDIEQMLHTIGVSSIDELFDTVPAKFRLDDILPLPDGMDENTLLTHLKKMATANTGADMKAMFTGAGAYNHHVPAAVDAVISRSEFYTSYTPYQPEISQGTLQAVFEYQTMAAQVMGTEIANASMYDGATAVMEAAIMARKQTRKQKVLISGGLHPNYIQVLRTYLGDDSIVIRPLNNKGAFDLGKLPDSKDFAALIVQTPNFFGVLEDIAAIRKALSDRVVLIGAFTEAMAFGIVDSPGNSGADIVAGEGQSLGLALGFGGPYLGMFGGRQKEAKYFPGRLVGQTGDDRGNRCYVMTLAAREQHIRRARASSNICTNVQLDALAAAVYLSLLGKAGYIKLALYNHFLATKLRDSLTTIPGVSQRFPESPFFNEFVIDLPVDASLARKKLLDKGFMAGISLSEHFDSMKNSLLLCATERVSIDAIHEFADALETVVKS